MHQLFTIDYLVHKICFHFTPRELSLFARVSSTCYRCAIPLLYKDLQLRDALEPLGKMKGDGGIGSANALISDEDFERFLLKYAPYVQSIYMDPYSVDIAHALAAAQKCVSKGVTYLFPNVRMVVMWVGHHSPELLQILDRLLTPDVNRLNMNMSDPRLFYDVCALVMTRISALHYLEMGACNGSSYTDNTKTTMVETFGEFLTFFAPSLASVRMPLFLDKPSVVECLSRMPNLWDLSISNSPSNNVQRGAMPYKGDNREGFPSLHSFSYDGSAWQYLHDTFWRRYDLTSLTAFAWNVNIVPVDVERVISTIVIACPRLITLMLGPPQLVSPGTAGSSVDGVPWSYIQPIIHCKELAHLSLKGMRVDVGLKELTDFLKTRKTWTHLRLFTLDPLCLQVMLLYAEHCPDLQEIGISIDLEKDVQPFVDSDSLSPHDIPTFSALRFISFGYSRITRVNSDRLIKFLRCVCKKPPNVHVPEDPILGLDISKLLASLYKGNAGQKTSFLI